MSVQRSNIAGEGLFAEKEVSAGAEIFSLERPRYAVVDSAQLQHVCSYCFVLSSSDNLEPPGDLNRTIHMKTCTGCRTLRYCSKQCQAKMWPYHKRECKLLGQLNNKGTLPNAVRLVIQIITHNVQNHVPLSNLQSHLPSVITAASSPDEPFKKERYETLRIFSKGVYEYTGQKLDLSLIQNWFAIVYTNALTISSSTFDPLGICIDEVAAKANHSCDPNAFIVFDGIRLTFRALKPIREKDEISISYIDNTRQFAVRQKELLDLYYFRCSCSKCHAGATLKEDYCWKKVDEKSQEPHNLVTTVATSDLPEKTAAMLQNRTESAYIALEEAKRAASPAVAMQTLQQGVEQCLKYGIWPPYRQPLPSLRHESFVNLLSLGKWSLAFQQGLKIYFDVHPIIYPEPFHPLRVVQKWSMAKLALVIADDKINKNSSEVAEVPQLDMGDVILGFLIETMDNVKCSHGQNHSFARSVKIKYDEVVTDMTRGNQDALHSLDVRIKRQWEILRQLSNSAKVDRMAP